MRNQFQLPDSFDICNLVGSIVPHSNFVLPNGNEKRQREAATRSGNRNGNQKRKNVGKGRSEDGGRMTEDGTKKVTEGTKERSGSGVKNTKESSERNSTDSGFKRLKVKIRYSYSFVKEFDCLL